MSAQRTYRLPFTAAAAAAITATPRVCLLVGESVARLTALDGDAGLGEAPGPVVTGDAFRTTESWRCLECEEARTVAKASGTVVGAVEWERF